MGKEIIQTDRAALPVGPYSQGIRAGGCIYVAGEKGIDPATNTVVPGGVAAETRKTLENIEAILQEAGAELSDVVSAMVFLTDLSTFSVMNEVYGEFFKDSPPCRTCVEVTALPAGASVEITVTALDPAGSRQ